MSSETRSDDGEAKIEEHATPLDGEAKIEEHATPLDGEAKIEEHATPLDGEAKIALVGELNKLREKLREMEGQALADADEARARIAAHKADADKIRAEIAAYEADADKIRADADEARAKMIERARKGRKASDLSVIVGVVCSALVLGAWVFLPPTLNKASNVISLLGTVAVTVTALTIARRLTGTYGDRHEPVPETRVTDSGRAVIARAANACEHIAGQHLGRARFYLTAGVFTAVLGIVLYIMLISATRPRGDRELRMLQGEIADTAVQLSLKKRSAEELAEPRNTAEVAELLLRAERLEAKLEKVTEKDADTRPIGREILLMVRNSIAFLVVEIMAGFLFSLAQRNDLQASHWRAHRQAYERLLGARDMMIEMSDLSEEKEFKQELLKMLITPTPATIFAGKSDTNPSLEAISTAADLIQRGKDAVKEKSA